MSEDFIELHHWSAFRFGTFEHRLCGYVIREENVLKCIVSDPIIGVNIEHTFVATTDGKRYKLLDVIDTSQKIDMMYVLDRWMSINFKGKQN
jgi:hypothetical protein